MLMIELPTATPPLAMTAAYRIAVHLTIRPRSEYEANIQYSPNSILFYTDFQDLRELCCPPLSAMSSRSLRSSQQGLLLVPFARTSTKQIRAFSVVGPSTWNGLPSELRIFNRTTSPAF